jgi:hypothetical protein
VSGEAPLSEALTRLKAAYLAWHDSKGESVQTWLDLCADEIWFGSLANGQNGVPFTTRRQTKAELHGYFDGLRAGWEMIHFIPSYFMEDGDRIVMFGRTAWRNRKTGAVFDTPKADFWRFKKGKAIEFFEMYDTAAIYHCTQGLAS